MVRSMKEKYYTEKNIEKQAKKYLEEIAYLREGRNWDIEKKKAALLVIDMQKYFVDETSHFCIPSARAIVKNIKSLQDAFLSHQLPVFQTRHLNTDQNAGQMFNWWGELIREEDPISEIIDDLHDDRVEIIKKSQYDALLNTNLETLLKSNGVNLLVVTGVMTHLCCESTTRGGFMRGYEMLFTIDATATHHEDFHRATLMNLAHGFAVPFLTSELLAALNRKNRQKAILKS
jgi:bifunctional isochorismate lyase/aryl carrier protein